MSKIGRNEPCLCGSGLKHKHCCGARRPSSALAGLVPGIRMRGGIRDDPSGAGFVAVIHSWNNIECRGEPTEWLSAEVFPTEDAAMEHYKTRIRPALQQLMAKIARETPGVETYHKKLE